MGRRLRNHATNSQNPHSISIRKLQTAMDTHLCDATKTPPSIEWPPTSTTLIPNCCGNPTLHHTARFRSLPRAPQSPSGSIISTQLGTIHTQRSRIRLTTHSCLLVHVVGGCRNETETPTQRESFPQIVQNSPNSAPLHTTRSHASQLNPPQLVTLHETQKAKSDQAPKIHPQIALHQPNFLLKATTGCPNPNLGRNPQKRANQHSPTSLEIRNHGTVVGNETLLATLTRSSPARNPNLWGLRC